MNHAGAGTKKSTFLRSDGDPGGKAEGPELEGESPARKAPCRGAVAGLTEQCSRLMTDSNGPA